MRESEKKSVTAFAIEQSVVRSERHEGSATADTRAVDDLFSLVYEELLRLASALRRRDADATVGTGTLAHEAFLKLRKSPHLASLPPSEFVAVASRAMRQVLVDAARKRQAEIRGVLTR